MKNEADGLREVLESAYHLKVDPGDFRADFARALRRSFTTDAEEFAALIFAEVWSAGVDARDTDDRAALRRVLDRVQHRLSREVRRRRTTEQLPADAAAAGEASQPTVPEIVQHRELVRETARFLGALSPKDAMVFERILLNGESVEAFAADTGMSRTAVYRARGELQKRYKAFLDRRPGTAAPGH